MLIQNLFERNIHRPINGVVKADQLDESSIWRFFGSGKSHFIKVLSYLLRNREHSHDGQTKRAIEFFQSKIYPSNPWFNNRG